jgi:DNA polymerase III epsilon subunit-like protein
MLGNKSSNRCPIPLPCSQCTPTRSFLNATALANHRLSKHALPCTVVNCTKTFPSQEALEQHLGAIVHGGQCNSLLQRSSKTSHDLTSQDGPSTAYKQFSDTKGKTSNSNTELSTPVLLDRTLKDSHNQSPKPMTFPLTPSQEPAQIRIPSIQSVLPESSRKPQKSRQNMVLSSDKDQHHLREELQQCFHAIYSIEDCYLVSIPRDSGGSPLVTPLVLDRPKEGFDFALLVSTPENLQQHTSDAASLGSCESCRLSLTAHFGSSPCITTISPSAAREPSISAQTSRKVTSTGKTAVIGGSQGSRNGKEPTEQALNTQSTHKWTAIPKDQQSVALTALLSRCHSHAILAANKFIQKDAMTIPLQTPTYDPMINKRSAVALDCEMIGVGDNNDSEVARISVIDYLTGEILIDTLVQPLQRVTNWRTKYSGISKKIMATAINQGKVLQGWPGARASLFNHIDANTVIVGQALNHDLIALGIQHQRIVDSAILTSAAVGPNIKRRWGLKDLCDQLLGIQIQNHGKTGHDSVEDAFAAREVVLWCIEHPKKLKEWGSKQRKDYYSKKMQKPKAKAGTASHQNRPAYLGIDQYDSNEDDEMMRWSDIAEDCGWPHPDTGYDPWSD